jgi:hypothetical protein
MSLIMQLESGNFRTTFRGRIYTLIKTKKGWSMWNQRVGGLANPPKPFYCLKDVEAAYKHWAGIEALSIAPLTTTTQ